MSKDKDYQDYTFAGQHPDEEVELVFRQHPIVMRVRLIIALLVLTASAVPLSIWPLDNWVWKVFLGGFVVALLIFAHRMIGWFYSIFIVTDERLIQISQKGFFNRKVADISHAKIQSVNYEIKGVQASMLNYGTIIVQTYVGDMVLLYIHRPENVHQLMVKQMRSVKAMSPAITENEKE